MGFVAGVDPHPGRVATMNSVTGDLAVATVVGGWNDAIDLWDGVWDRDSTPGDGVRSRGE